MADPKPGVFAIFKRAFKDFMEDDCMTSAAALSYYTVFSLPAILMLLMLVISSVMDPSDVQGGLESQLQGLMGPGAGGEVRTILQESEHPVVVYFDHRWHCRAHLRRHGGIGPAAGGTQPRVGCGADLKQAASRLF